MDGKADVGRLLFLCGGKWYALVNNSLGCSECPLDDRRGVLQKTICPREWIQPICEFGGALHVKCSGAAADAIKDGRLEDTTYVMVPVLDGPTEEERLEWLARQL